MMLTSLVENSYNKTFGLVKSKLKPDADLSLAISFTNQQGSCHLLMLLLYPSKARLFGSAIKGRENSLLIYGTSSKIATNI